MRIYAFTAFNAHLAGQTALVGGRETGLYYQDEERVEQLVEQLMADVPGRDENEEDCVVGMTEVWDQRMGQRIIDGVRSKYPYSVHAPFANGIGDVLSYLQKNVIENYVSWLWPGAPDYLMRKTEQIVDEFSQSHYKVGRRSLFSALRVFVPEDWVFWPISRALSEPLFWGAGLLLLSRHPLDNVVFTPFTARADLERFAGKGILKATVRPPGTEPIDAFLVHYQEGISRHAREARRRQVQQTQSLVRASPHATVVMGDMNIEADTLEYAQMMLVFRGMRDAFRVVHPDRLVQPGYTFDYDNPFTRKQLGASWGQRRDGQSARQRIDYVLAAGGLAVIKAEVRRFLAANGQQISDHDAIRVALALAMAA